MNSPTSRLRRAGLAALAVMCSASVLVYSPSASAATPNRLAFVLDGDIYTAQRWVPTSPVSLLTP